MTLNRWHASSQLAAAPATAHTLCSICEGVQRLASGAALRWSACVLPSSGLMHPPRRGATFIWTLTPYNDPFGNQNCVYAPSQGASANTTYFLVDSDSDDFNAVHTLLWPSPR